MIFFKPKISKMTIVYKQLYYNTELYINIVLATKNMFSLSKVTIYMFDYILKYIDFMISSSTFHNNARTIGFIHVIILHTMFFNVQIANIYSILIYVPQSDTIFLS